MRETSDFETIQSSRRYPITLCPTKSVSEQFLQRPVRSNPRLPPIKPHNSAVRILARKMRLTNKNHAKLLCKNRNHQDPSNETRVKPQNCEKRPSQNTPVSKQIRLKTTRNPSQNHHQESVSTEIRLNTTKIRLKHRSRNPLSL